MNNVDELAEWPPILRTLARTIGHERTMQLADAFGGVPVYIPHDYRANHLWAPLVTELEWQTVAAHFGGDTITLPRGLYLRTTKRLIHELIEQGRSPREVAMQLRIGVSHVYRVLRDSGTKPPPPFDPRQLRLFDDE